MRILHTADWHAGKTLAGRSRIDELSGVLREIADIAERESVDVVLLAGDVFDQKSPGPEAERVVYGALADLNARGVPVVIVAGNHDHPDRWSALKPLLDRFTVQVVPTAVRPADGGTRVLKDRSGRPALHLAALPWVPMHNIVTTETLMLPEDRAHAKYADSVSAMMRALAGALNPDLCTAFIGHLTVSGARTGGGERALTMGDVFAVDAGSFPAIQYVALGHIHLPQPLPGRVPARYAGSVMQLDFGESTYQPSVTLVDLEPGLPARVTQVPLTVVRPLMRLSGTMEEIAERRGEFGDAYLRVDLNVPRPAPGLGDTVRELFPNALSVHLHYPKAPETARRSVKTLTERERFARYLETAHGGAPDPADLALFETLLDEVTGGVA